MSNNSVNIVCIGGGPAGLYLGILMKKKDPRDEIVVIERNRPYDTFGWGVVFSDQTLGNLVAADEPTAKTILRAFNHWDDIDVFFKGRRITSGGHGFCGIGRKRLLNILQARCEELGVGLVFEADVTDERAVAAKYGADLVVACDGVNSGVRTRHSDVFRPEIDVRRCRFVWLGTKKRFGAFTFAFEKTEHGWFQAHIYQFDGDTSTFIVETPEEVWRSAGLDRMSQEEGIRFCERLFASQLEGHPLLSNATHLRGSAIWIRFPRIVCARWVHRIDVEGREVPIVLMGDAAHTAHYSIGSGTKLALEDAIELARCFSTRGSEGMDRVLSVYEELRSTEVLKIQSAARNSMEWFENVDRYTSLEAEQFAYSMLTRSQRIPHENLRLRDAGYVAGYERFVAEHAFAQAGVPMPPAILRGSRPIPPMLTPFRARGVVLKNRIVVSPMAQYSAVDGIPGDYHLVHLGARAMGGAGMVCAEMTCTSPDARITPGCTGLWNDAQRDAWRRIVDFVHAETDAKIAMQLGHAGAKGSTCVPWSGRGADYPLPSGNWPLVAASAEQYLRGVSQTARAATRDDLARIKADFVAAARRAAEAGFDWLELHCAHGYLLSSFISPLTNRRHDEYGGEHGDGQQGKLAGRCRYPLEVFAAIREVWPKDKPISVRISAHDWMEGGITPDDAVVIGRLFKAAGADMIDCSSGQVLPDARPVYGRMYQTPFADRIRNEAGIATIAVGAIFEADHANGIIAAGRADLCAIAGPHLANPAWTLTEAAKLGYGEIEWPRQYRTAKVQLERNLQREKEAAAANAGLTPQEIASKLLGS